MTGTLEQVLEAQRRRDLLGSGAVTDHIDHAERLAALVDAPGALVDLGSGGGVPGLVLLSRCWPEARGVLLDSSQRRCTYLEICVADLDLGDRVEVRWARAEDAARDPALRGAADLVVARSFGPPAATAECGAGLLRVGGTLLVSEPPQVDPDRWPAPGLARLGLGPAVHHRLGATSAVTMVLVAEVVPSVPRRAPLPFRRPTF